MSEDEIERFAREHIGRPIVVVGASTGSDTHSVGIDAMLNLKGYHGHHGLEGYQLLRDLQPRQPGAQQRPAREGDRGRAPTRSSSPRPSPSRTCTCTT